MAQFLRSVGFSFWSFCKKDVCVCVCSFIYKLYFRASWELKAIYSVSHTEVEFAVIKKAVKVVNSIFPITFLIFCPSILETYRERGREWQVHAT